MGSTHVAKPILAGLLLAGLVRLQGGAGWTPDAYGFASAGLLPADQAPQLIDDDGRAVADVVVALKAREQGAMGAGEHLARAVLRSPRDAALRTALGVQLADEGDALAAVAALKAALTIDMGNAVAWHELARAFAGANQVDNGVDASRQALRLRPG